MNSMIFDAHCDTALKINEENMSLQKNNFHLDISRMEEYNGYIQIFAAFVDQKDIRCSPMNHCLSLLKKMHEEIENNGNYISLIQSQADLKKVRDNHETGAILSLEGGEALEGNLDAIWMYYKLGVRLITLTWNYANELADGISEPRGGGLTDFGRRAVQLMEKIGIIIDVSHLSYRGFWDVAECTKHPFVASHSCVKALCNHPRNLNDEQIETMIKRNCCIVINFFPEFLTEKSVCTISDIIRHMKYIIDMGGERILGLGSDFDGVSSLPDNMNGVQDMSALITAMHNEGFSENQIKNIVFENFYRIFCERMS